MAIHWKAFEQYFTVVLFGFQFQPVCNFGKFVNCGLGTVRSERVTVYTAAVIDGVLIMLKINLSRNPQCWKVDQLHTNIVKGDWRVTN